MRRRPRRRTLVAVVVGLVLAVAVGAWPVAASRSLAEVEVGTTGPWCQGAKVRRTVVRAEPGMRCTWVVSVSSWSDDELLVDHVAVPAFGPEGGSVLRVTAVGDRAVPGERGGGPGAVLATGRTLPPRGQLDLVTRLRWRESGCTGGRDAMTRVTAVPRVSVRRWGFTRVLVPRGALRHTQVAPSRGCRRARG